MPPEGPNKAEELLQRYAKERRERGGDFSLHPATRRLLHGEVARELAKAGRERRSWFSFWAEWKRARWVAGSALATIAIVSVTLIATRQGSRRETARSISARAEKELFFARAEQLVEAAKEPSPPMKDSYSYQKDVGRGFADFDSEAKTKTLAAVPAQKVAIATKPRGVALLDDMIAVTPTNGFSYSVRLARAQNAPAVPNGTVTQQSLPNLQLGLAYTAPAAAPQSFGGGANADAAATPLEAIVPNNSTTANSPASPVDEARFGNSVVLQKQLAGVTGIAAPSLQAPQSQQSAFVATAPAGPVNKMLSEQLALSDAPARGGAVKTGGVTQLARYYRLNRSMEDIAQRTVNGTAGRAALAAGAAEANGALLNQFTIEQQGNTLRLRDADGSLYEGALLAIKAASQPSSFGFETRRDNNSVEREKIAERKKESVERVTDLSFVLTGTNLTSGQLVTVRGRFEPATNNPVPALAARRLAITAGGDRQSGDTKSAAEPLVIDGTLRVGNGREQPFRAVPAQP